jgi:hypothetical protein
MVKLRKLCDDHGILLIADEIQSGFGRTGKFFAMEHYGVEPDLITVAKSLAGGFPLAGVVGRAKIMDAPDPGGIGGTYAGNPIACAAALGVFEAFEQENLLEKAEMQGKLIMERMKSIKAKGRGMPIGDVRGLGAMCAFELVTQHGGNEPDAGGAKALAAKAPDLLPAIRAGEMTITQANREVKERGREQRRDENRAAIAHADVRAATPGARFATITLDPPWDWGDEGDTMAWCCTSHDDGGEAYSGDRPVIESLAEELEGVAGHEVFVELRRRLSP